MIHTTGAVNHLSYGDVAEMDLASALTILWWWKPGAFVSAGGVMGKPAHTGAFRVINYDVTGKITIQDATGQVKNSGIEFAASTLVHAGFVFDGSLAAASRMALYANGTATGLTIVSNFGATLADGGAGNFLIGQETGNNTDMNNDFGHLKVWNAALTADEVKREMFNYRPQRTTNLILWCPFDDETNFTNYAKSAYTPTQTGTVTQTTGGEPTLYGAELEAGHLRIPQRFGRRSQRTRRGAFRPFGKLVPRFQDPL